MALGEALRSDGKFGKLFFTTLTNNSALLQIDMIKTSQKEIYLWRVASHSNASTMFSSTFYVI